MIEIGIDKRAPAPKTWGGKRPGAGRKPRPENVGLLPHVARPVFNRDKPALATLRTDKGAPSLLDHEEVVIDELTRASGKGFRILRYTIRTDHLHVLAKADDGRAFSRGIQRLSSRITMRINQRAGRHGRLWRERYHRRDLSSPRLEREALAYAFPKAVK